MCMSLRSGRSWRRDKCVTSRPFSRIDPSVGSSKRMTQFADGGLAAPRLADQPKQLARRDRERDTVDRLDDAATAEQLPPGGEVLHEINDLERGRFQVDHSPSHSPPG